MNWLHRFLHPHCEHCESERIAAEQCETCAVLTSQLMAVNEERRELQEALIEALRPKPIVSTHSETPFQPIPLGNMTWTRRREILEEQERQKAKIQREAKNIGRPNEPSPSKTIDQLTKTIDQLEQELGIQEEPKEVT